MIWAAFRTRPDLSRRHEREAQRRSAAQCETDIEHAAGLLPALRSRTHSRGVSGACAGDGAVSAIGLDAEFIDPARPWLRILTHHDEAFDVSGLSPDDLCLVWTLHEAWYKAFGTWAPSTLATRFIRASAPLQTVHRLGTDIHAWSVCPAAGFAATLVWRGDAQTPVLLSVQT